VVGRVTAVERDSEGRIVAVEIPGLEPGDAPASELVAENAVDDFVRVRDDAGDERESGAGGEMQRLR
jgi:hypothetical protein